MTTGFKFDWKSAVLPIIFSAFLGVLSLLYTNQSKAIDKKADITTVEQKIEVVDERIKGLSKSVDGKADSAVMIQMLNLQQEKYNLLKEQRVEQKTVNKEILHNLQNLNIQMQVIENKLN